MITPNSTIKFLKVPFSPSQNDVLKFSDVNTQTTYMNNKVWYTLANCTYLREGDGEFLKVNKCVDELYNCNYVMFQNTNYSNKWFYAFIEKLVYVNPKITHVYLKMDVFQTFQFDYSLQSSFIDRQTFDVDSYNTLHDTPSVGDLKCVYEHAENLNGTFIILFNADPTVADASTSTPKYVTIGNYTLPCYMYMTDDATSMSELVQAVSNIGRADRIQACYYAPVSPSSGIFGELGFDLVSKGDLNIASSMIQFIRSIPNTDFMKDISFNIPYTPTYKKELSYPYAKLEVVDKITGRAIELDLSKFADPLNPQFKLVTTITDSQEYKVIPVNYNGITYSVENALAVSSNTEIPVFSNSYAKYVKNNQNSNIINGVMSGVGMIGSAMTGNVMGMIGGFASVASVINADSNARQQPNQCSGLKGDAFEYLNFTPQIFFRLKVMDSIHMDIAREFWKAYGYPVRKVANFSTTSQRWNFIKTVGVNIIADTIPSEYQRELESIYDNGVTIWNNNYLDYSSI